LWAFRKNSSQRERLLISGEQFLIIIIYLHLCRSYQTAVSIANTTRSQNVFNSRYNVVCSSRRLHCKTKHFYFEYINRWLLHNVIGIILWQILRTVQTSENLAMSHHLSTLSRAECDRYVFDWKKSKKINLFDSPTNTSVTMYLHSQDEFVVHTMIHYKLS